MKKYKSICKNAIAFMLCLGISADGSTLLAQAQGDKDDPIIVVSMGDSYSSGEGIEPFYKQNEEMAVKCKEPDWLAHRSILSWSSQLQVEGLDGKLGEYKDRNWFFVASSGAVTDNFLNAQEKKYNRDKVKGTAYLEPQLNVFNQFEENTVDYVTLSIGGNDVGFTEVIKTAATEVRFIDSTKLTKKFDETWDKFYANGGIEERIKRAYENISERAGSNAKIIVAGYPKLLEQNGKGALFAKEQSMEINSNVKRFNRALNDIVEDCQSDGINIYFVSVEEAFDGHEAYSKDPYINEVILGTKKQDLKWLAVTSDYSIHPNATGAEKYAECVQAKINEIEEEERNRKDSVDPQKDGNENGKDSDGLSDKVDDKIDELLDKLINRFVERLDAWFNQWMQENCDDC